MKKLFFLIASVVLLSQTSAFAQAGNCVWVPTIFNVRSYTNSSVMMQTSTGYYEVGSPFCWNLHFARRISFQTFIPNNVCIHDRIVTEYEQCPITFIRRF